MKRRKTDTEFEAPRREQRLQHVTDLRITYEGGSADIPIRLPDLSVNGMFVNTSTHFQEGAIIKLRFRLTRSNLEVHTRGEVRYCLPGIGIGVEFVEIGREATMAIKKEIAAFTRSRHR